MSYETKYHPNLCKDLPLPGNKRKPKGILALVVLIASLIIGIHLRGREKLVAFLIPGDAAVTTAAAEAFAEDVRAGVPLADAVQSFCAEILSNE